MPNRRATAILAVAAAILVGIPFAVAADESPTDTAPSSIVRDAPDPFDVSEPNVGSLAPLARFGLADGLIGESGHLELPLVIPSLAPIETVTLTLAYRNSIDILPEQSALQVRMNGTSVASLPLTAFDEAQTVRLILPGDLTVPGVNRLELVQSARHRVACGASATFDLWTRLDLARSSIAVTYADPPSRVALPALGSLLGASATAGEPLTVLRWSDIDAAALEWATIVAQGYALHAGRPVRVRTMALPERGSRTVPAIPELPGIDPGVLPGAKNVLIGTRDQLGDLLAPALAADITGPFIGIYGVTPAATRFVVVISGTTEREVAQAAQVFADPDRSYPPQSATPVDPPTRPPVRPPPSTIVPGSTYRLSDFGFAMREHRQFRSVETLRITLPADYYTVDDRRLMLRLHAVYGPYGGEAGRLNIAVNGIVTNSLRLGDPDGGILDDVQIGLPMHALRPGENTLSFEATFPGVVGACDPNRQAPFFALSDRTTMQMPDYARMVQLPDLRQFARTGYPYAAASSMGRAAEPFELAVAVADDATVGAALTLVARLAHLSGRVVPVTARIGPPRGTDRHALIVGGLPDLAPDLFDHAPVPRQALGIVWSQGRPLDPMIASQEEVEAFARTRDLLDEIRQMRSREATEELPPASDTSEAERLARWRALSGSAAEPEPVEDGFWRAAARSLRDPFAVTDDPAARASGPPMALLVESDGQVPLAAILQFEAEDGARRVWTVVTAPDTEILASSVDRLIRPAFWDRLAGTASSWAVEPESLRSATAADGFLVLTARYDFGNLRLIAGGFLSRSILWWGVIAGTVVVLFGLLTHVLVSRMGTRDDG